MGTPCFTDPSERPTEESILQAVGRAVPAWRALFDGIRAEHVGLTEDWRYYADGKSWLLKVSRKSKTLFWLSVERGCFRVAFYFAERLTPALLASELSEERKAEIRSSAPAGKLRPVAVVFGPRSGVKDVMTLIGLKKSLK